MAYDLGMLQIIHAGAAELLVVEQESAGLDNVHAHPQAGAQADQGAAILKNIKLIEGESHHLEPFRVEPLLPRCEVEC